MEDKTYGVWVGGQWCMDATGKPFLFDTYTGAAAKAYNVNHYNPDADAEAKEVGLDGLPADGSGDSDADIANLSPAEFLR